MPINLGVSVSPNNSVFLNYLTSSVELKSNANSFTPSQLSGLSLWLDASNAASITQASGTASQINDLSGNGRNFTQAVGVSQPNVLSPGDPSGLAFTTLKFDAAKTMSATSFNVTGTGVSIYMALNMYGTGSATFGVSQYTIADQYFGLVGTTLLAFSPTGTGRVRSVSATASGKHVLSCVATYGATATHLRQDGTELTRDLDQALNSPATISVINPNPDGSAAIGEIIVYNRPLSDTEDAQVRAYLKRWGTP